MSHSFAALGFLVRLQFVPAQTEACSMDTEKNARKQPSSTAATKIVPAQARSTNPEFFATETQCHPVFVASACDGEPLDRPADLQFRVEPCLTRAGLRPRCHHAVSAQGARGPETDVNYVPTECHGVSAVLSPRSQFSVGSCRAYFHKK
jgi:hypothetical protein